MALSQYPPELFPLNTPLKQKTLLQTLPLVEIAALKTITIQQNSAVLAEKKSKQSVLLLEP
jgi:hypothetical protein